MSILKIDDLQKLLLDYYKKKSAWASDEKFNHGEYLEMITKKFSENVKKNGISSFEIREYKESVTIIKEMYEYLKNLEDYYESKITELQKSSYAISSNKETVN